LKPKYVKDAYTNVENRRNSG